MTRTDRLVVAANLTALAVLAWTWSAAAGEVRIADQLLWASVATIAAAGVSVADVSYLLVLRRRLLDGRLALDLPERAAAEAARPAPAGPTVVVAGGTKAHLPDCLLVAGKPVQAADEHRADRARCPVCCR